MSSPAQVHNLDRLPSKGALIIPGRLNPAQASELLAALGNRNVTWLAEESTTLDPALEAFLQSSGKSGASFSKKDNSLAEIGKTLSSKISGDALIIFVPGKVTCLPATACQIPLDTIAALCQLGLPISPLDISVPAEASLSVENKAKLPSAVLNFGNDLPVGKVTPASYREAILAASEESFSKREFFNGSLTIALIDGLKRHGQSTTLFDGTDDSELGFDKVLGAAIALSKEIKNATKKKRVGILLPPGKGGVVANLAVLIAGKIPVNLNFTASREAVKSSIRQADLDKFITADPFVRKVPDFPWPPNRDLIFIERLLPQIKKRIIKWVVLSKILPTSMLAKILGVGRQKGDDEAILLFTSGSSGEPKGVPLSHRNLLANVTQFGSQLRLPNDAKLLGCLPLFHSLGCTVTLWFPVIEGLDLVTFPSPLDNKRLAELIEKHSVDLLLATPTFLRGYMRRIEAKQLASLKIVITGAEKLPENLANSFYDKFGKLPMEGYGLTETSPGSNVNLPLEDPGDGTAVIPAHRSGSVGPNLPGVAMKITNAATDEPAALNESGIIWLKGANVFQGYLDKPELSKEILKDGWFKSGDVGRVDDDGFLYIEGRISRFSKIAGEMVPHETVEAAVNKVLGLDNEAERKIAIVGVPDEKKGEAILLLSTIAGEALEQEALDIRYKLLDEGLPSLWCPKTIIPTDHIPVLASGKLDIKACQAMAEELR
ncbi:AMP-binding protein [Akkermansiaceae bacterium]|nr:AMP-binding protein [Akkermansiaceae bacterium]